MGTASAPAVVLDAGPLVKFERGDQFVRAMIRGAVQNERLIVVPSGVLAQVWRNGSRQTPLVSLLASPRTRVDSLDERTAKAAGALCGRAGTADIVDASVVVAARLHRAVVVTSDPGDLRRLDPHLDVEVV